MTFRSLAAAALLLALAPAVQAQSLDLSTHVLDLARGVGGADVAVTLELKTGDAWRLVGRGTTAENGRVSAFTPIDADAPALGAGIYRLTFDMSTYWSAYGQVGEGGMMDGDAFFPEIVVQFRVADPSVHVHVPVVVSPYGYSTYRGN